jgi:hypothetical protein
LVEWVGLPARGRSRSRPGKRSTPTTRRFGKALTEPLRLVTHDKTLATYSDTVILWRTGYLPPQHALSRITCLLAELFLDADELVILGRAVGAGE